VSRLQRLLRREQPPREAMRVLDPGERVVAWARVAGSDAPVLATPVGLWVPRAEGPVRVAWSAIDKAVWRDGALSVTQAEEVEPGVLEELPPWTVRLTEARNLPDTVRVRVTGSVGYSASSRLTAGGSVRVVGRRVPGQDGLRWYLLFRGGADRTDPATRAEAQVLLAQAQATTG